MNISQRITQARQKAGLSPQELAQAIQVSEDDVLRWESGLASPDAVQLAALCRQFQVTSDYLLFGTQPQPPACPGCGAPIQEDSSFCPKCGRRLSGSIPGYALVLEHSLYAEESIETLYRICRDSGYVRAFPLPANYTLEDIRAVAANAPQILFRGLTLEQASAIPPKFMRPDNLRIYQDATGDTPLSQLMEQPSIAPIASSKSETEEKQGMTFGATVGAVILGVICAVLILSFL